MVSEPEFRVRSVHKNPSSPTLQVRPLLVPGARRSWQVLVSAERWLLKIIRTSPLFVVAFATALLFSVFVPFNVDEFIHYYPLICHFYPNSTLNVFRAGCHAYDLNLLNTGLILPLRSFDYSGSFPALYYYPFFLLWKSPLSARLLSMLFLLFQAMILGKIFRFRVGRVLAGLIAFFPYVFQHVVDTGPVAFHLMSVFLLYMLFRSWVRTLHVAYPVLAGIILFLCLWTKLVFFALLPGIMVLLLLAMLEHGKSFSSVGAVFTFLLELFLFLFVAGALTGALLLSTDPDNPLSRPLLDQLLTADVLSWGEFRTVFWTLPMVRELFHPLATIHRVYQVMPPTILSVIYSLILYVLPLIFALVMPLFDWRRWKEALTVILLYACFVLTFFLLARVRLAWAMHHTVLSFPFLILGILTLFSGWRKIPITKVSRVVSSVLVGMCTLFVSLNVLWFLVFPLQPVLASDDTSKILVNHLLKSPDMARRYFYVVLDWGMYHYQGLYGDTHQSVLYPRFVQEEGRIDVLKDVQSRNNRKLLFIANIREPSSDLSLILRTFRLQRCKAIAEDAAWQVYYEADEIGDAVCGK